MLSDQKYSCLFTPLDELPEFLQLTDALKTGGVSAAYGLDDTQRSHIIAAVALKTERPVLVLAPNDMAAQRMAEDINALLGGGAAFMPTRDVYFMKAAASSRELSMRRIEALGAAVSGELKALVVPVDAAMHRLMPADKFKERMIKIDESMRLQPSEVIERLVEAGYERVQLVEARGQCALRGGILDIYPVGEPNALRIEFFDDEIDSIRTFDVMTQRSISKITSARIFPAEELIADADDSLKAASALERMLSSRQSALKTGDRQKQIEQEFDLMPVEDFLQLTYNPSDDDELPELGALSEVKPAPKKPAPKTRAQKLAPPANALERNFRSMLDAFETNRRADGCEAILPMLLKYENTAADYLNDPIVVFDQPERLRERCENRLLEFKEQFTVSLERDEALPAQGELLMNYDALLARFSRHTELILEPFLRTEADFKPKSLIKFVCRNATGYQTNVKELASDLTGWIKDGWRVALLAGGVARGQRLENSLLQFEVTAKYSEEIPAYLPEGAPLIFPLGLGRGFLYPTIKFAVISESDVYGISRQKSRARAKTGEKLAAFTELKIGDYVVHENHGIGQYMGTIRLASEGTYRDFLHIRYAGTDKLYVPTDQLDRVQKYIGSEGEAPKLNRLSGGEWQKQKSKVKTSIREIAGELIKLYAHRESAPGHAFDPDTPWQREFEDNFPFDETPDQLTAIEEIKRDMESPR